jgi:hypothetical protein
MNGDQLQSKERRSGLVLNESVVVMSENLNKFTNDINLMTELLKELLNVQASHQNIRLSEYVLSPVG